jgi:eukaryotic-like serine/threonine-protein kinase
MATSATNAPRRQGGKEELRASLLKTYLLRIRAERGEQAVRDLLARAGVDAWQVDNERGWLSSETTKRALREIADVLGDDGLRHRGSWAIHSEALGTHVRMLRVAKEPIDAYRYLANNAKEVTRVATWELEELPAPSKSEVEVRLTYRPRTDNIDELPEELDGAGEELLSAAREGELASFPVIWGLGEAKVTKEQGPASPADPTVYRVRYSLVASSGLTAKVPAPVLGAASGVAALGAIVGVASHSPLGAAVAAAVGGGAGYAAGLLYQRLETERAERLFEKNRIAALERGLELRGDLTNMQGDLTGAVLGGKFRIGRKLGSGGIGVVYAAEHTTLGHEVAIKVLRGAAAKDGSEIARLRREAYIQVSIEHPNVVRVVDLDQMPDGSIYLVMERLVGRSLADKLSRENVVAPGFAVPVFIQVCRALYAAHKKNIVHRDLKPGNVFLCDDGSVKVLDFGMGKLTTAEALTQQGYTLGTPEYMAPEQCIGGAVEARTDLYALGVLMYEALTGELPINSPNRRDLLDLHQRMIPPHMRMKRPDLPIPEELDAVIMRCLKKRVSERPKTALELEEALASIDLTGLPVSYPLGTGRRAPAKAAPRTRPVDVPTESALETPPRVETRED